MHCLLPVQPAAPLAGTTSSTLNRRHHIRSSYDLRCHLPSACMHRPETPTHSHLPVKCPKGVRLHAVSLDGWFMRAAFQGSRRLSGFNHAQLPRQVLWEPARRSDAQCPLWAYAGAAPPAACSGPAHMRAVGSRAPDQAPSSDGGGALGRQRGVVGGVAAAARGLVDDDARAGLRVAAAGGEGHAQAERERCLFRQQTNTLQIHPLVCGSQLPAVKAMPRRSGSVACSGTPTDTHTPQVNPMLVCESQRPAVKVMPRRSGSVACSGTPTKTYPSAVPWRCVPVEMCKMHWVFVAQQWLLIAGVSEVLGRRGSDQLPVTSTA